MRMKNSVWILVAACLFGVSACDPAEDNASAYGDYSNTNHNNTPGDNNNTSGDNNNTSGDNNNTSGDNNNTSGNNTPNDTSGTPNDTGSTPGDTGNTPDDTGSTPDDTGSTPDDTGSTPDDTGSTPDDSDTPLPPLVDTPKEDFTETVNGVSFDMVFIEGGTFTLGCETAPCPADAAPVSGVVVSSYHIGKTEVTVALWNAVMDDNKTSFGGSSGSYTGMTWYDAMAFACQLRHLTGRNYHMTTEAEWEYAAKNHVSRLEKIGSGEEWAYNTWSGQHMGGTDPVGPQSGLHTQKTRRDAQNTADNITGRLIRSIEGTGPALRLAISAESDFPPGMVHPCDLKAPQMGEEPVNSYRDPRWVTGSNEKWAPAGSIAIGSFDVRVWEDGTAKVGNTNGQWFTSNNIAFVFVPTSGNLRKYAYIFLDDTQGSLISETSFMSGGFIGRIERQAADSVDKPTIAGLKSGAELAADAGPNFAMVDMVNIPASAKQQDPRLLDGPNQGWFQDNRDAGGVHHYRKDVDPDEFRFTVNQGGNRTMLANGEWFTVNNTFLRVTHASGYTADYLYAVDSSGTFYHNSFMAYERGDFRMFKKTDNNSEPFNATCGSICSDEIPKNQDASLYSRMDNGHSTFVPAPCPAGGCQ